jgi:hypothetical protein
MAFNPETTEFCRDFVALASHRGFRHVVKFHVWMNQPRSPDDVRIVQPDLAEVSPPHFVDSYEFDFEIELIAPDALIQNQRFPVRVEIGAVSQSFEIRLQEYRRVAITSRHNTKPSSLRFLSTLAFTDSPTRHFARHNDGRWVLIGNERSATDFVSTDSPAVLVNQFEAFVVSAPGTHTDVNLTGAFLHGSTPNFLGHGPWSIFGCTVSNSNVSPSAAPPLFPLPTTQLLCSASGMPLSGIGASGHPASGHPAVASGFHSSRMTQHLFLNSTSRPRIDV